MENNYELKFLLLGLPTWALVDGTWAVLAQLAETLPAGYNISSYLMLSLTLGNVLPLVIGTILRKYSTQRIGHVIQFILTIGFLAGVFMAVFWDYTVPVHGGRESLPLYFLFFIVGACSSSSNVTHFTYVSLYEATNTTALATGMGVGSMLAGILAIVQGFALLQYGFSVSIYFLVLALLYLPAMASLYSLSKRYGSEFLQDSEQILKPDVEALTIYSEAQFLQDNMFVLVLQFLISSLGFGVVPAIISYACGKFNNPSVVLLLATGIASVVDPVLKAATAFVLIKTIPGLLFATVILFAICSGLLVCACMDPNSTLYEGSGGALPIILYIVFGGLFGFTNTSIFRYFKENVPSNCVQHAYRYGGIAAQTGALIGSLLTFCLIITDSID